MHPWRRNIAAGLQVSPEIQVLMLEPDSKVLNFHGNFVLAFFLPLKDSVIFNASIGSKHLPQFHILNSCANLLHLNHKIDVFFVDDTDDAIGHKQIMCNKWYS